MTLTGDNEKLQVFKTATAIVCTPASGQGGVCLCEDVFYFQGWEPLKNTPTQTPNQATLFLRDPDAGGCK